MNPSSRNSIAHRRTHSISGKVRRFAALEAAERAKQGTGCHAATLDLPAQIGMNQRRPGAQGDATTYGAGCEDKP